MKTILNLSGRNINVFVRNRSSVFFSFLSVIIIIGLYALFLGQMQVDSIKSAMGDIKGIRFLVDSWIMAGLLSINAVTISLGVMGTMVRDMEDKRFSDFIVAPISRTSVALSYLLSAWIIGLGFSLIALAAGELYIVMYGGQLLGIGALLKVIGLLALDVISSSTMLYLIVTFIRSTTAYGTLSTLIGTLIGFIAGIYIPMGVMPAAVQKGVLLLPFSHSAAAIRQAFCAEPLSQVFAGAPAQALLQYQREFGIRLFWGDNEITMGMMLAILGGVAVVFLALAALRLRKIKMN